MPLAQSPNLAAVPAAQSSRPPRRRASVVICVVALLIAFIQIGAHAYVTEFTWIRKSIESPDHGVFGKRSWGGVLAEADHPPRIFLDNDCYYWIAYCRELVHTGQWRIRYTHLDNTPDGRPMHWDSGVMWWILLVSKIGQLFTHQPIDQAIESGASWANPILFVFVLTAMCVAIARRSNAWLAGAFVITLAAMGSVDWDFGYGVPGHHGFHDTAMLGQLLCLILGGAGWIRGRTDQAGRLLSPPSKPSARRWFIAAGLFTAMGLWIGATQQVFVIGSVGLAALAGTLLACRRPAEDVTYEPTLWRAYGVAAGLGSIAFYLLEYFPHGMAMRLEVNHPLYALFVFSGGELVCRMGLWLQGKAPSRAAMGKIALAAMGVVILPAALLFGPQSWHAWHDPYIRRLHDRIMEFLPLLSFEHQHWWQPLMGYNGLLIALPLAAVLLAWRKLEASYRSALLIALFPAITTLGMTFHQVRWSAFLCCALLCILLTATAAIISTLRKPQLRDASLGLLLLCAMALPQYVFWTGFRDNAREINDPVPGIELARAIASRDIALNLKRLSETEKVRVMSGPNESPSLQYFGGVHGTGSLYWENIAGNHAAADFFADYGDADAKRIARERRITYVVVEQNAELADYMHWVKYGTDDPKNVKRTLAYRLADPASIIPDWLEPAPYYGSPQAASFGLRLYRVIPEKLN